MLKSIRILSVIGLCLMIPAANMFAQQRVKRPCTSCNKNFEYRIKPNRDKVLSLDSASKEIMKSSGGRIAVNAAEGTMGADVSGMGINALIPPSPTAASLGVYGDYSLNPYSGQSQITIPLVKLEGRKLSADVSLSYRAGLKVDEIPGWVGAGWTLNAGGAVTRVMKGRPDDEASRGFFAKPVNVNNIQSTGAQRMFEATIGNWDTEADIFYFNFDEYSGKLVFDQDKNVTLIPYQNLKVVPTFTSGTLTSFTITTGEGIQYSFGTGTNSIEITNSFINTYTVHHLYTTDPISQSGSVITNENLFIFDYCGFIQEPTFTRRTLPQFNSTWYLSEKKDLATGEKITYAYEDEGWIFFRSGISEEFSATKVVRREGAEPHGFDFQFICNQKDFSVSAAEAASVIFGCFFNPNTKFVPPGREILVVSESQNTVKSKRLKTITSDKGQIGFTSELARADIQSTVDESGNVGESKALTSIKVFGGGFLLKEFAFTYHFMVSEDLNVLIANDEYTTAIESKRLFLDKVTEKFNTTAKGQEYTFKYVPGLLPIRHSAKQDYLGYFNANQGVFRFPRKNQDGVVYPIAVNFYPSLQYGASTISPSAAQTKIGSLESITFPTGGVTKFYYELNDYNSAGVLRGAPGLRISSIENYNGTQLRGKKTYRYKLDDGTTSSGVLASSFSFTYQQDANYTHEGTCNSFRIYSASQSLSEIGATQGNIVGYDRVEEIIDGKGKNVYYYKSPADFPDVVTPVQDFVGGGQVATDHPYPFPPASSMDFKRGLLDSLVLYNTDGKRVKSTHYTYRLAENYFASAPKSAKVGHHSFNSDQSTVHTTYGVYTYPTAWVPVASTEDRLYDQFDPGVFSKRMSTILNVDYIPVGQSTVSSDLLPRKITKTFPGGEKIITETKYPNDYNALVSHTDATVRGIYLLKNARALNVPIETITYQEQVVNGSTSKYITGGQINTFKEFTTGYVYPWETKALKAGAGLVFTTFPWSTVGSNIFSYQTAWYKNNTTFSTYDAYGNPLTFSGPEGIQTTLTWVNSNSLVGTQTLNAGTYQHQSTYTHQTMVGVTTETDPNGVKTTYLYDDLKRLKLIKDTDNNIVSRYRYHFRGQDETMPAGSITTSSCKMVGQSVTFYASLPVGYGQTTYEWNFGDGTTQVVVGSGSVNHTFNNARTFHVKVRRTNPEYFGESNATLSVSIASIISSVSICAQGIVSADLCGENPPQNGTCGGVGPESVKTISSDDKGVVQAAFPPGGIQPPTLRCFTSGSSYNWQYKLNSGAWMSFGSNSSQVVGPPGFGSQVGSYSVRCIVADACGNDFTSNTIYLTIYESQANCAQP